MHEYFLKQVEAVSEEYVNLLMKMSVVFKGKNKFAQVLTVLLHFLFSVYRNSNDLVS